MTLCFVQKLQCGPRTQLVRDTVIISNRGFMLHVHAITLSGLSKSDAVEFARRMGFSEGCADQAGEWILRLYDLFIERDATLIEINPMTEDLLGRGMRCRYMYNVQCIPELGFGLLIKNTWACCLQLSFL